MASSRRPFTAVYEGICQECGEDIFEGDSIAYLDDEVVCEPCWELARDG